jgi:hypothetical protein
MQEEVRLVKSLGLFRGARAHLKHDERRYLEPDTPVVQYGCFLFVLYTTSENSSRRVNHQRDIVLTSTRAGSWMVSTS